MTLRTYVTRRLLVIIPTFFFITLMIFAIIHLAPGDPARVLIGERGLIAPEQFEEFRRRLGLDEPIYVQYFIWLGRLLQGNLGYSFVNNRPVNSLIGERIPNTLELVLAAEIVSVIIAVVLGVIAAVKHYSLTDAFASVSALMGYSTPNFWLAVMAILLFSVRLGWLPTCGTTTLGLTFSTPFDALADHLKHLVLPAGVLVVGWTAYLLRMVRSSMLEVLEQDYIITARAKGLKERVVIYKHALRNALLPVITYEGYSIGYLFGGAAIIESIFAWPGLGQFMVDSALIRDYPTLMGLSVIIALSVLFANLLADVSYALADPRIRYD